MFDFVGVPKKFRRQVCNFVVLLDNQAVTKRAKKGGHLPEKMPFDGKEVHHGLWQYGEQAAVFFAVFNAGKPRHSGVFRNFAATSGHCRPKTIGSMKHLPLILTVIFSLFLLAACEEEEQKIRPEILRAEALVDSLPEKALTALKAVGGMDSATEAERMKFALLKNKAEDKLYQIHTNDSTMKAVVEYYKKRGTWEEKMEAYYQLGGTYRDIHDAPKAIDCYTQAMLIGEKHPEETRWETLSRVYGQLAWLLGNQGNIKEVVKIARKKSRLYHDKDYYSLQELGLAYNHNGQNDSALYYEKAARRAVDRQQPMDTAEMLDVYGSGLSQAIKMGDSAAVKECYERLRHFSNAVLPTHALVGKSYYFEGVDDDSFRICLEAAYRKDDMIERRMAHATRLSHYYYGKDDLKTAMRYALARDSMYEVFEKELQLRQAANAYSQYVYYRDKQQELEMKEEKAKTELYLAILSGIFIFCAFTGYLCYRHYRDSMETLEKKAGRLTIDRDELQEKTERLTADKEELQKQLLHHEEARARIDGEQLRARLHQQARKERKDAVITQELLDQVIAFVMTEHPGFYKAVAAHNAELGNVDLMILYLQKTGMNQTETARLLGRSRSTVSHRLATLAAELGGLAAGMEDLQQEIPEGGKASGD